MRRIAICVSTVFLCSSALSARERAQHVKYADEAGSAHVAVMSITPWDEAKSDLQPSFALSEADALTKVVPTTGQTEDRLLDIVAASLKVATPTLTTSKVREDKTATGQADTSTTDATRTKASGDVSKVADATTSTATAAGLPGAPAAWTGALDNDPMLQVLAATALKQEYALINRYVKDAAVETGAHSYVVRMQFTTLPSRRNLPYDVFTNVSFLPGELAVATSRSLSQTCGKEGVVSVIPLLVTDDIEGILASNTSDKMRQFGFSLLAMLNGIGLSAGVQKTADQLNHSIGKDLNSLFTIARLSSDTIRVRLGANSAPAPVDYAMVPRTHSISLLVSVSPKTSADCLTVTAVARTEFHDAETGAILKQRPFQAGDYRAEARELGHRYWIRPKLLTPTVLDSLAFRAAQADMPDFKSEVAAILAQQAEGDDGEKAVGMADPAILDAMVTGLYSDILATKAGNYFTYVPMRLDTTTPSPVMPATDQAVVVSVGSSPATVHLDQGMKLSASKLFATLKVGSTIVVATSVSPSTGGNGLDIAFPALKDFGVAAGASASLEVSSASPPTGDPAKDKLHTRTTAHGAADVPLAQYANVRLVAADAAPVTSKPAYALSQSADAVVAGADSSGQVGVLLKAGGGTGAATLGIVGADVTAVTNTSGNPVSIANGVMNVGAPGAATIGLRNLHPGGKVLIQLYDAAGKPSGKPIEFPVQTVGGKAGS